MPYRKSERFIAFVKKQNFLKVVDLVQFVQDGEAHRKPKLLL